MFEVVRRDPALREVSARLDRLLVGTRWAAACLLGIAALMLLAYFFSSATGCGGRYCAEDPQGVHTERAGWPCPKTTATNGLPTSG